MRSLPNASPTNERRQNILHKKTGHNPGQSVFVGSVKWLASMLAIITTFLLAPKAYGMSVDWIIDYTTTNYGYGFEEVTKWFWGIVLSLTIFFFSRATVSTSLIMGGLALASKMF